MQNKNNACVVKEARAASYLAKIIFSIRSSIDEKKLLLEVITDCTPSHHFSRMLRIVVTDIFSVMVVMTPDISSLWTEFEPVLVGEKTLKTPELSEGVPICWPDYTSGLWHCQFFGRTGKVKNKFPCFFGFLLRTIEKVKTK
jgi:hypothetical protein